MPNKKINQLVNKTTILSTDLFPIGDGTSGQLFKKTIAELQAAIGGAVISVNGLVGTVVLDTDDIQELGTPTNKYFTDARARGAVSATSPLVFNSSTGVFSMPAATTSVSGHLTSTDWNTFNGKENVLTFSSPLVRTSNTISMPASTGSVNGYLSSTDWTTFNNKQGALTLTVTGSSGASALVGTTLNIPTYTLAGLGGITASFLSGGTGITYNSGTGVIATTITQYTDALARAAHSFTAGSGAYNSTTGVITIPTNTNQLTNGASFITLASLSGGTGITYNSSTGAISYSGTVYTDASIRGLFSGSTGISYNSTTGAISSTITQYTDASARAAISGGTGISYNSTTGVITNTITQYTDALARASLSFTAGSGGYNSTTGVITIPTNNNQITNGAGYITSASLSGYVTGSGTTNYIPKFTNSSAIGNSIIAESGNSIGIGTAAPQNYTNYSLLEINNTSGGGLRLKNTAGSGLFEIITNSTETYIKNINSTPIWFGTNNLERMRLDASGNLGIGTSSPSYLLDVNGIGRFSGGYQTPVAIFERNANYGQVITLGRKGVSASAGIGYPNDGNISFLTGATERVRIDASGNLGLAITPSAWGGNNKAIEGSYGTSYSFDLNVPIAHIASNAYNNGTNWIYKISAPASRYIVNGWTGEHIWYNAPSGTAGNAITFTQAMTLDSNGRLGIGNTTPGYRLQVDGDSTAGFVTAIVAKNPSTNAASAVKIGFDGGGTIWGEIGASYNTNNPYLAFFVRANSEKMRLTDNGNLAFVADPFIYSNTTAGGTAIHAGLRFNSTDKYIRFFTNDLGRMDISNNGNLLVGTTTDSGYKLDVNGTGRFTSDLLISSTGNSFIVLNNTTATTGKQWRTSSASNGNFYITQVGLVDVLTLAPTTGAATFSSSVTAQSGIFGNSGSGSYSIRAVNNDQSNVRINLTNTGSGGQEFSIIGGLAGASNAGFSIYDNTNATTRLYINSSGSVGIGTSNPAALLHVLGTESRFGGVSSAFISFYNSTGRSGYIQANGGTDLRIASETDPMTFYVNSSDRGRITTDGNWLLGTATNNGERLYVSGNIRATGTITANSDIRLKKNLERIENALEKVGQISGYTYNTIYDDKRHGGVIAQEIDEVFPEIVNKGNDGLLGVEYGNISALLIEALKELKEKNTALEARLQALEK